MKSNYIGNQSVTKNITGYIQISLEGKLYKAHRLAWLYMTGAMPQKHLDHKNRTTDDNRWENLREATITENNGNSKIQLRNKSGHRGVVYYQGRWQAQLMNRGKNIYLGRHKTKEEAAAAYRSAAIAYFGAFANVES